MKHLLLFISTELHYNCALAKLKLWHSLKPGKMSCLVIVILPESRGAFPHVLFPNAAILEYFPNHVTISEENV